MVANENIRYGGPIEKRITQGARCLGDFILKRFEELDNEVVLIDGTDGSEFTASKIKENSIEIAKNLRAIGIKEGHVVGICCENRIENALTIFATSLLNATIATFNSSYTEHELEHVINITKPRILFASKLTIKRINKIAQKYSFIRNVVCFDDEMYSRSIITYEKFMKLHKDTRNIPFKVNPTNLNENTSIILCSSGTTGLPKGVELSQNNILWTIDLQYEQRSVNGGSTILCVLPWFHTYGLLHLIVHPTTGSKIVFLPKFQGDQFLSCIQRYRVTAALLVTPLMVFLEKSPLVQKYDLSSLKLLYCSAAPVGKKTVEAVKKRLGVPTLRQGYGLTESTTSVTVQTDNNCQAGSVGALRKTIYGKVVDTETGKALGPNQSGELCFRGGIIMKGYMNDREATEQTVDSEGWLHTGDVGYYDENGNFFIVDRIKELIKYKGFQVPPAEIEALLLTNPKIKDAGVVGVADVACGELPLAFVVKTDENLTSQEVMEFVAERLSLAKHLHGGVKFVDEIPRTQSGKILRRKLRAMLQNRLKSKL